MPVIFIPSQTADIYNPIINDTTQSTHKYTRPLAAFAVPTFAFHP